MSVSLRLDRLDAALGKDHAGPEPLDVEQDLKIVLDFATNAKTNRHLVVHPADPCTYASRTLPA